ncbi:MAG: isocitrate lyase/PEP mutase family protein [Rhodobiaceae bacterium]|nr:isocitrate lyase/PEP mutase family protein [Rhodobiaceae bacterium]
MKTLTDKRKSFASRLRTGRTAWAAGAYDALSARCIESAGFDAVFTTGFGISAAQIGAPDVGLYTMSENLAAVRGIAGAVAAPVIADGDTGYGNAINVMRTVREFEAAGVCGLTLEDQVSPKTCPVLAGKPLTVPIDEAAGKIRAAVAARTDPDFLIIGRTDARDMDEALVRARAYADAGADLIQPVGFSFAGLSELQTLRQTCGLPLSVMVAGWYNDIEPDAFEGLAGMVTFPLLALFSATAAMQSNLAAVAGTRRLTAAPMATTSDESFSQLLGYPQLREIEARFLPAKTETN